MRASDSLKIFCKSKFLLCARLAVCVYSYIVHTIRLSIILLDSSNLISLLSTRVYGEERSINFLYKVFNKKPNLNFYINVVSSLLK